MSRGTTRLALLFTTIFVVLYTALPASLVPESGVGRDVSRMDTDRGAVPAFTLLEPMTQGDLLAERSGYEFPRREPTIVEGLLQVRQTCDFGNGLCYTGVCCPLDSGCCSNGKCCPSGYGCCKSGGCCRTPSEYCVVIDGVPGCCPTGEICDRISGGGGGGGGGGAGKDNTTPHTTHTTHTIHTTHTTHTAHTTHTTSTIRGSIPNTSSSTPSSGTPTQSLPTSRPTVGVNELSSAFQADDRLITWSGTGWNTGSSSCTNRSKRTNTPGQSFTLIVASALRMYLNLDCLNAVYHVYINGNVMTFTPDAFDSLEVCIYKEMPLGTNTRHINLTVVVIGLTNEITKRQGSEWQFQLNEIMVVDYATAPPGGSTNGATAKSRTTPFYGLTSVILAGFGLPFVFPW